VKREERFWIAEHSSADFGMGIAENNDCGEKFRNPHFAIRNRAFRNRNLPAVRFYSYLEDCFKMHFMIDVKS
jgi:hypothetical protein